MITSSRKILYDDGIQLGPYPLEKLPRCDVITSEKVGPSQRRDARENILAQYQRGDYGQGIFLTTEKNPAGRPLFSSIFHITAMPQNEVSLRKTDLTEDPAMMARHIKRYTYFLGADMVGICRVPDETVYTFDEFGKPLDLKYKYAIVFLLRKDIVSEMASHGNEWIDDPASWSVYQRLALISVTLADYIRGLGYEAEASCNMHYETLMPRLVVEAGLGEFSRAGIALNPFVGMTYKTACVLCNLPLECDRPVDFGLQDYCKKCTICAEQCCSQAIPYGDKEEYNGYMTWRMDAKRCAAYCISHTRSDVCQRCTIVCPFNRPDNRPEDFSGWDGDLSYIYDSVNRQRAYLETHDYIKQTEQRDKWWLPLRYDEDGSVVEVPEKPN